MIKQFIKQNKIVLIFFSAIIFSFAIKACCMYFVSHDMTFSLLPWVHQYHIETAIECLKDTTSDYPALYNYFLMIIAHVLPANDVAYMHAIKTFSIIFDIVNATAAYLIVKQCTNNKLISACAFAVMLLLPDIIINGATWGQCDVIYTSFLLWFIYFLIKQKSHIAMIFLSFAFCFKVQTIFIFPFLLYLILKRKIKIYQPLYVVAIYFIVMIPELAAGHPFAHAAWPYSNQVLINYFLPNIYFWVSFTDLIDNKALTYFAIVFAFAIMLAAVIYCYVKKVELTTNNIIFLSLFSCFLAPFVLPRMHERYFFPAEIISVVYFFVKRDKSSLIITTLINLTVIVVNLAVLVGPNNYSKGSILYIVSAADIVFSFPAFASLIYEFKNKIQNAKLLTETAK